MSKIKVILSGENLPEAQVIEIEENTSIEEIVILHKEVADVDGSIDEYEIFIEDADTSCDRDRNIKHHGIGHHHRIHCHRCKHVSVELQYNVDMGVLKVSPSTTGQKILSLLPTVFPNITPKDAADLRLQVSMDKFVGASEQIGIFVSYPDCQIKIDVVAKKNVNG